MSSPSSHPSSESPETSEAVLEDEPEVIVEVLRYGEGSSEDLDDEWAAALLDMDGDLDDEVGIDLQEDGTTLPLRRSSDEYVPDPAEARSRNVTMEIEVDEALELQTENASNQEADLQDATQQVRTHTR